MENAADALKMAFAMFVFIVALSIVFSLIGRVKETADSVLLSSDRETYYQHSSGENVKDRENSRRRYSNCNIVQNIKRANQSNNKKRWNSDISIN